MAQMLASGFDCWVEKPYYRRKTPLVVGASRTQVLVDSMAIAASELNRCHFSSELRSLLPPIFVRCSQQNCKCCVTTVNHL